MLHNLILQSLITDPGSSWTGPLLYNRLLSQIVSARYTWGRHRRWRPSPSCSASWWRVATGNGVWGMCRGTCFPGRSSRGGLRGRRRQGAGWVADAGTCWRRASHPVASFRCRSGAGVPLQIHEPKKLKHTVQQEENSCIFVSVYFSSLGWLSVTRSHWLLLTGLKDDFEVLSTDAYFISM